MTSNEMSKRDLTRRSDRRGHPPVRWRSAPAFFVPCMLLLLAASTGRADEPFRLRLVRDAADVQATAESGEGCVRGKLYLVREFSTAATGRGVWIGDTLEVSPALPSGVYAGVARDDGADGETGWHIELPDLGAVLRAEHGTAIDADAAVILLGRRDVAAGPVATCDPARDLLRDGDPIRRRLRDAYASSDNQRSIQVSIEP